MTSNELARLADRLMAEPTTTSSSALLADLPDFTDLCGCSLLGGRCESHREMMREIHEAWQNGSDFAADLIWALSDGYGEPGFVPTQGYDWSGIRDSSTAAIEAMYRALHA